ncbi:MULTISPECIES: diguanylate cyclase [unclassified Cobetia]|uniref:GGDEF domain-containing protein n=1 Tax=unclassified Cobetia TaxID=2609414 RepID=UPI0020976DC7|nr:MULTISPECIES: diguanylate cyclase [unclassified Cobetia]MCO7233537.1 diguanylate cyclase [Cobetia sp. Dlab-2-AX]MCO7236813.1 diguanylate cyclase [Cobetia sp. Dlab-2-U]
MNDLMVQVERQIQHKGGLGVRFPVEIEARFEQDIHQARSHKLALMGLVAIVIYVLFLFNDWYLRPDHMREAIVIRVGVMTPITLVGLYVLKRGVSPIMREMLMTGFICLAMILTALLLQVSASAHSFLDLFALGLIVLVGNVLFQLRFWYALCSSIFHSSVMLYLVTTHPTPSDSAGLMAFMVFFSITLLSIITNLRSEKAERLAYLLLLREQLRVEEFTEKSEEFRRLASIDPLTEVYNRRHFDSLVNSLLGKQAGSRLQCAVAMIDVDHFKAYNDHYGHVKGDQCLKRIATAISESVHPDVDIVARFGGEEFVVLLPFCTSQQALARAEEICRHVRDLELSHAGNSRHDIATVSIGVSATGTGQNCSFETLLKQADEALYRAKASGRDRCELFAQQNQQALGRAFAG